MEERRRFPVWLAPVLLVPRLLVHKLFTDIVRLAKESSVKYVADFKKSENRTWTKLGLQGGNGWEGLAVNQRKES